MKRFILPFFVGVLFLIFQTTLLPFFPIQRIRPDILLIFTLYLTFLFPPISGGILALVLGSLTDLFSGNAFGFYTFSRPFLFFAAYLFKERFYLEGFSSQFLFVFVFGNLEGILILILLNAFQPVSIDNFYHVLCTLLLPHTFFTGLITPILFLLFQKVSSPLFREPESESRRELRP